jgi:hypothetical protein
MKIRTVPLAFRRVHFIKVADPDVIISIAGVAAGTGHRPKETRDADFGQYEPA